MLGSIIVVPIANISNSRADCHLSDLIAVHGWGTAQSASVWAKPMCLCRSIPRLAADSDFLKRARQVLPGLSDGGDGEYLPTVTLLASKMNLKGVVQSSKRHPSYTPEVS